MVEESTPAERSWLRYLAAAAVLAAAFIGFSVLTAAPTSSIAFSLTASILEQRVKAGGSAPLTDGTFTFSGSRLSFTGTVAADRVSVAGQIVAADRKSAESFKGEARVVDGKAEVVVRSGDGQRVGALSLSFPSS
jgi:hypothetical protein